MILQTGVRLPEGASVALAKPTKYHYYPHNQHIYLLPECAVQQVCNAVYVRLNFTQPLCACPGRYRDPCSASLDSDDLHTTELVTDPRTKVSEDSPGALFLLDERGNREISSSHCTPKVYFL